MVRDDPFCFISPKGKSAIIKALLAFSTIFQKPKNSSRIGDMTRIGSGML